MADDGGRGFGIRLAACRRVAGLSQEELAERSGLSLRAVGNLERGRTKWPHPDSVRRLADALGLRGSQRGEFVDAAGRRLTRAADAAAPRQVVDHGAAAAPPLPVLVPRQLPAPVGHFAGRARELEQLSALAEEAADGGPTVVISAIGGMAGVGKTALAVRFAHQVARRFPDGQLYVNLRGFDPSGQPVPPAEALGGFLMALGVQPGQVPADLEVRAGLYRSLLAGRRMLILLDNACDAAQVRPLLPGSAGCLVIVTSRNQLAGLAVRDGARLLALDVLSGDDAAGLLAARLGREAVAGDAEAVAEITGLCGRLPLALAIAAARAAARPAHPLAALAAELREAGDRLDALDAGEPAASTRAVFSWSYIQLSVAAARMFGLLGLHPGPDITAAAAASLAGVPPPEARGVLRELTSASLLAEHAPGRYLLHDLLRAYAQEQAGTSISEPDREAATGRMLDHYLHTANGLLGGGWRALDLAVPARGVTPEAVAGDDDLTWFEAEHQIMLRLAAQAAADSRPSARAWQLPWTMAGFLDRQGYWDDWAAAGHAALAAAEQLGDRAGQARACHSLGQACIQLGRYADGGARLRRALDLYAQLGDRDSLVNVHLCCCVAADRQHRYPEALSSARQALDLLGPGSKPDLRAIALNNVGYASALNGDYHQALIYCAEAIDLYRELGGRFGEAAAWDSLGYAHWCLGHDSQAVDCYQRALRLHVDHRFECGRIYAHLGDAYQTMGNAAAAKDAWQQALAILDELHHPDAAQVRAKLDGGRPAGCPPVV